MLLGEPKCVDYLLFISFVTDIFISYSAVTCGVLFYGIIFTRLHNMTENAVFWLDNQCVLFFNSTLDNGRLYLPTGTIPVSNYFPRGLCLWYRFSLIIFIVQSHVVFYSTVLFSPGCIIWLGRLNIEQNLVISISFV
jgi:hypothetical protein